MRKGRQTAPGGASDVRDIRPAGVALQRPIFAISRIKKATMRFMKPLDFCGGLTPLSRWLCRAACWTVLATATANAASPTLYGLTLGEPLRLAECPWPHEEAKAFADARGKPCYVTGSTGDGVLRVIYFPAKDRPALAKSGTIDAIEIDGRIEAISWATEGVTTQNEVLSGLTEKFGTPTELQTFGRGDDRSYVAKWIHPDYRVMFRSGVSGPKTSASRSGYVEITTPVGWRRNERLLKDIQNHPNRVPN